MYIMNPAFNWRMQYGDTLVSIHMLPKIERWSILFEASYWDDPTKYHAVRTDLLPTPAGGLDLKEVHKWLDDMRKHWCYHLPLPTSACIVRDIIYTYAKDQYPD